MTEQVLVVKAKTLTGPNEEFSPETPIFLGIDGVNKMFAVVRKYGFYMDRQSAEGDESFKQIIPYCVLKNTKDEYLVYKRTKKGGDARLHEKFSIGIGGHINPIDRRNIFSCAMRELQEELTWSVQPQRGWFHKAGLIYDDSNSVGRVHLGVVFVISVPGHVKKIEPADSTVTSLDWFGLPKLKEFVELEENLENWSKLVVEHIL